MRSTAELRRNVLLVDDEVLLLRSLERALRVRYAVKAVTSADEALLALGAAPFDAVVSDDRMPGRSGTDLLREVGERWPGVVRILMTGYASIESTIEAVNQARIAAFLKKPLRPAEIEHALEGAFAHQRLLLAEQSLAASLAQQRRDVQQLRSLVEMSDDVRARRLAIENRRLVLKAHRDPLTGLLNRRGLLHLLAAAMRAERPEHRLYAALYLDVDHFKRYNDQHGHPAGDALLREVARALERALRTEGGDLLARWGGEEFVAVLLGADPATACLVARRLLQAVRGAGTTISIGVAACPAHGSRLADVFAAADAALYEAKQLGRDRVHLACRGMPEDTPRMAG